MRIFPLFNRRVLRPSWSFTPGGNIWRLLPSQTGEFVGEARDQDKKRVTFFAVNADSGTPLWSDRSFDEAWWMGIEEVGGEIVLVHGFASPDMPQHKGIVALGLRNGAQLWENKDWTYWFIQDDAVIVHKTVFEKRIVAELDIRSGNVRRELNDEGEISRVAESANRISQMHDSLVFPEIFDPGDQDSPVSRVLREEFSGPEVRGDVEFAVSGDYVALNVHRRSPRAAGESETVDNEFKICDAKSSRIVYADTIARNARGPVPDSFFLWRNVVYYIKDQKTITAVRLS